MRTSKDIFSQFVTGKYYQINEMLVWEKYVGNNLLDKVISDNVITHRETTCAECHLVVVCGHTSRIFRKEENNLVSQWIERIIWLLFSWVYFFIFFIFPVFCLIWLVFFVLSSSQWGLADLIVCRDREMNDAHRNMSFSKQKWIILNVIIIPIPCGSWKGNPCITLKQADQGGDDATVPGVVQEMCGWGTDGYG